jgi:alanyl-tRNA synthetase
MFCGNDGDGYKFILASNTVDLKASMATINAAISGRGGGSAKMIQGSCTATRAQIEQFFANTEL